LLISIDEQHAPACLSERHGEVGDRGGFTCTSFVVHYGDDAGHRIGQRGE